MKGPQESLFEPAIVLIYLKPLPFGHGNTSLTE
jgi:hypothetical protein